MNGNSNNDEALRQAQIAGAVAEIDPQQMAIVRRLTPAQRFEQMQSMIDLVEGIAAYRLRQRQPELGEAEALRIVRSRDAGV
jgi:hypothetical protein